MVPDSQGDQDGETRLSRARNIMDHLRRIVGDIRMSVFSSQEAREAEVVLEEIRSEVRSAGRRSNSTGEAAVSTSEIIK